MSFFLTLLKLNLLLLILGYSLSDLNRYSKESDFKSDVSTNSTKRAYQNIIYITDLEIIGIEPITSCLQSIHSTN